MASVVVRRGISRIEKAKDVNFPLGVGNDGKAIGYDHASGLFVPITATATPGGSNTQVQYNSSGVFAGHSGFTYDGSGTATLSTALVTPVIKPASDSVTAIRFYNAANSTAALTIDTTNTQILGGPLANGNPAAPTFSFANDADTGFYSVGANRFAIAAGSAFVGELVNDASGYHFRMYGAGSSSITTSQIWITDSNQALSFLCSDSQGRSEIQSWKSGTGYDFPLTLQRFGGKVAVGQTTPTALLDLSASTTSRASLRLRSGTAPTSPNDGDIWYNGSNLHIRIGGTTYTLDKTSV